MSAKKKTRLTLRDKAKQVFADTISLHAKFGDGCEICHVKARSGMVFHHVLYRSVNYRAYAKNASGRLAYAQAVYAEVEADPTGFMLVCKRHHYLIESVLRYSDELWNKLTEIRNNHKKARGALP